MEIPIQREGPRNLGAEASAGYLMTVQEAARVLRIGRNTCYELIRRGQLPHIRLGRLIRVPRHALMLWLGEDASIAITSRQPDAAPSQRH